MPRSSYLRTGVRTQVDLALGYAVDAAERASLMSDRDSELNFTAIAALIERGRCPAWMVGELALAARDAGFEQDRAGRVWNPADEVVFDPAWLVAAKKK